MRQCPPPGFGGKGSASACADWGTVLALVKAQFMVINGIVIVPDPRAAEGQGAHSASAAHLSFGRQRSFWYLHSQKNK